MYKFIAYANGRKYNKDKLWKKLVTIQVVSYFKIGVQILNWMWMGEVE